MIKKVNVIFILDSTLIGLELERLSLRCGFVNAWRGQNSESNITIRPGKGGGEQKFFQSISIWQLSEARQYFSDNSVVFNVVTTRSLATEK